ncbi:glycosyltransferase family 2 protein [Marinobacter sp.]|uniref:glycosyltransferase family 2 protein n=1 Tax=Marinobacter sp. TaxID=50741 RepID=UPI00199FD97A|nr:glycosyltransferase family 2 protein [Marinobacter sp.]MBC7193709.1 glycosyltransferase [Marinobacter sp.]
MKISVITACFNSKATIRDAIESVLSQDHNDVEYILVDGASTDNTMAIVGEYRDRISQVISEPDSGIYDALNKGIRSATGDLVGFLHSDDLFAHSSVLSHIAAQASSNNGQLGCDAVYGDLNYVSSGDTSRVVRRWTSRPFQRELLSRGWMPPHPTLYLKREIYESLGGFDLDYRIAADYESILRYFSQPGFSAEYLPETLITMRLGGASNGTLSGILRKSREDYSALRKNRIPYPWLALAWKNLSKLPQFLKR